jgi:hypothetical protein
VPDHFTDDPSASPPRITSGGNTTITYHYESDADSTLSLSCSPGFKVSTSDSLRVPAAQVGQGTVSVKITRTMSATEVDGGEICEVKLTAFGGTDYCLCDVTVTS